jgi:hypothetical protein
MAVVEDFNVAASIVRLRYKLLVFSCVNLEFNSKITQIQRLKVITLLRELVIYEQ